MLPTILPAAVDGNDGRIKDYFPREAKIKYASKGNGGIDFKSMNLIHNVGKGELVCELTMPTEPQDGMDVFGQPVRGKNGTMPPIPQGKNVVYSPERDRLLTACEGNLTRTSSPLPCPKAAFPQPLTTAAVTARARAKTNPLFIAFFLLISP